MVVGIDVHQDPTQATATLRLNFAREKMSILAGTPQVVTYDWDIVQNAMVATSGSSIATATGGTTYTTTLPGGSVLSTLSWSQSSTQLGNTRSGVGGGAGKAEFADVLADTRTGPATIALLRAVASGEVLPTVELAGCEISNCATTTLLSNAQVTKLVLGSPTLYDQVQFTYGAITWKRNDDARIFSQNQIFSYNIAQNVAQ
ncbi:hypothetical protein E3T55_18825 [Cryobacterium frigoriphilum]|uniref:Uncharacterized protein n=2 Tax=Cryobacterium frigoriphilum TaxID=1259150 RepID=A0A4R8ZU02_9MICO|nr:hypothetical protein E3T55_18825 [Cryobacterium frigoriphilum]